MHQDLLPWLYILLGLLQPVGFFFFSFPFSLFFSSIWQIRFLILVPAEGNKELCCWSNDLICTLMNYCSQFYHPLATGLLQASPKLRADPSPLWTWCCCPAAGAGRAPHQRLDCSDLLAHVLLRETDKPCRKRNASRKARSVIIQNVI